MESDHVADGGSDRHLGVCFGALEFGHAAMQIADKPFAVC